MSQNSKRINTWYKNIGKSEDEQKLSNGMSYCDKLGTFFSLPDIHRDVLKYCRHPDLYHGGPIVNYCHKIKVFDVWEVLLSASQALLISSEVKLLQTFPQTINPQQLSFLTFHLSRAWFCLLYSLLLLDCLVIYTSCTGIPLPVQQVLLLYVSGFRASRAPLVYPAKHACSYHRYL